MLDERGLPKTGHWSFVSRSLLLRVLRLDDLAIVLLLTCLFSAATLVHMSSADGILDPWLAKLRYGAVGVSLLLLLLIPTPARAFRGAALHGRVIIVTWLLFSLAMVVSATLHGQTSGVLDSVWFLVAVPTIFFAALPTLMAGRACKLICWALLLGSVPYVLVSLLKYPVELGRPYAGVFGNPSNMGQLGAGIAASAFVLVSARLSDNRSGVKLIVGISLAMAGLALILASGCRGALLALLGMLLVLVWHVLGLRLPLAKLAKVAACAGIPLVCLSFAFPDKVHSTIDGLTQYIIQKQEERAYHGDILSGRGRIWKQTLDESAMFGHGGDYFRDTFALGPHNSIIHVLGNGGLIAATLFTCFVGFNLLLAARYARVHRNSNPYAGGPLIMAVCWLMLSMALSMFGALGSAATMMFLLSVGIVITDVQ